ncbi:MAG: DUF115 domain-containing protein [Fretibacterium sp.]|nr:DUF115 domain-containing protein [Fretibacterium sp.]
MTDTMEKAAVDDLDARMIDPPFELAKQVLEPYRGRYKGQRCFIIGNGPSLRARDLDLIKGEFSIGTNRIYLIFDQTEWRPTVFTMMDAGGVKWSFDAISALECELKILGVPDGTKMYPVKDALPVLCHFNSNNWMLKGELPPFSDDITDCVYNGMSITYINFQIAAFLGFSEIYLLGMDHRYPRQVHIVRGASQDDPALAAAREKSDPNSVVYRGAHVNLKSVVRSNFCENYLEGLPKGPAGSYNIDEVTLAYRAAKKYGDEHGIKIMNATRGGFLEVFPRIDLDKLMGHEVKVEEIDPPFEQAVDVLREYKGRFEGQRCFIIGNGPSLKAKDLDQIKREFSIASHRIYKIFRKTDWRPTFFTALDPEIIKVSMPEMSAIPAELKLIGVLPDQKMYPVEGALPFHLEFNAEHWVQRGVRSPFSEDFADVVHQGMSATYVNIQLAVYLGFKELILLGVDHQYQRAWNIAPHVRQNPEPFFNSPSIPGRFVINHEVKQNHFCEDYLEDTYDGKEDNYAFYCPNEATLAFEAARQYAEEHGITILNATRGGALTVFDHVNFDKFIQRIKERAKVAREVEKHPTRVAGPNKAKQKRGVLKGAGKKNNKRK